MRMAGPDIVLFVIGAILFGGAAYALYAGDGAAAGGAASALGVFTVDYALETIDVGEESVSMRSGSVEFEVNASNVQNVIVTVACNDQAPGPAAFQVQVQVEGPGGITGEGSGACGTGVEVAIPTGATMPATTTVSGSTETEARENLGEAGSTTGTGTWTVTVSGSRGQIPGLPVGDPAGTVALSVEVAQPRFSPVQR